MDIRSIAGPPDVRNVPSAMPDAAEPAKGHSALRASLDLRLPRSTCDVLLARARAPGLLGSSRLDYRPGQKPAAGAGHRMSLAISA
jgi:hypothetical protein